MARWAGGPTGNGGSGMARPVGVRHDIGALVGVLAFPDYSAHWCCDKKVTGCFLAPRRFRLFRAALAAERGQVPVVGQHLLEMHPAFGAGGAHDGVVVGALDPKA